MQLTALRTRLARRILALFFLCALVPISTLGVLAYYRVRAQYTDQAGRWLHQLSKEAGLTLIKRLSDLADQLSAVATRSADGTPPALTAETTSWIRALGLATAGRWRAVQGLDSSPPELSAGAARNLQAGQTVLLTSTSSQIWFALQVPAQNASAPAATLWAEIDPVALLGIDQSTEVLPVGTLLCVLNAGGTPLYCPQGIPPPLRNYAYQPGTTTPVYTWRVGTEDFLTTPWMLFLRGRFSAQPWTIAVSLPAAAVQAPMAGFRRTFPLVVLLTLLFALALGYTLIRRNTEPLARLQEGTRRLANLDFTQPVHVTSGDEFEDLAHSFNAMARQIEASGASLRENETRLRTLLESAPAGVITTDAAGTIEFVNETAEQVFGALRTDLIGRPVEALVADAPSGVLFREPGEARELLARRGDGSTFPIELSVSPARLGGRTVFTGFVRDVSDRKRAEEERARLEGQLRQSQKLETIGTLAGGVAHDFNNVLAGVIGYVEIALSALPADSEIRDDLLEVKRAGWRGAELARQILVFSRRTETKLQFVHLDEIVVEALKLLRAPPTVDRELTTVEAVPEDVTGHEHVLVVDDDTMVAAVTRRVLERLGYRVTVQTSSVDALALLRSEPERYDLVLTDYTMPRLTGMELARAAHLLRPDLPILLTSGLGEVQNLDDRQVHGIRELLTKPVSPSDLGSAIRRALSPVLTPPS